MEKSTKIGAQIYGYTVCLVAVITFLISVTGVVSALMDMGDPLHSGHTPAGSPSLASYENYKMDILKSTAKGDGNGAGYTPDEQTLRTMYQSAKDDKIQSVNHQARQSMIIGSLMILISIVLFATHWRWMQSVSKSVS
jgi:hypothetical protein